MTGPPPADGAPTPDGLETWLPARVRTAALEAFGAGSRPVYAYDLTGLAGHAAWIRAALPDTELYYAAKANPDAEILRTLAPHVDGIEVSSGGELDHVRRTVPGCGLAFGGPGKTDDELDLAVRLGVGRIHVESPHELRRLADLAARRQARADILLRANPAFPVPDAALTMSGPFGMDEAALDECAHILAATTTAETETRSGSGLRLRGIHLHVASGLGPSTMLELAARILSWARSLPPPLRAAVHSGDRSGFEINLGGGMGVDYTAPDRRFDWGGYGRGLAALRRPGETLRIEPGRAVTAYHGWYITEVLDIKRTRGDWFAVLRGGTHHLRTPVAKGHDQPFTVIPRRRPGEQDLPCVAGARVTLVGQLCTPKDVFARKKPVKELRAGDLVAFAMAGAYAWNISHHDFLMHPQPRFIYIRD